MEEILYLWNKYNIIYSSNITNVIENDLSLYGLWTFPTVNSDDYNYVPTLISTTLNQQTHTFDVLTEKYDTRRRLNKYFYDNATTEGIVVYGYPYIWSADASQVTENSGYKFNKIPVPESYLMRATPYTQTGISDTVWEFTFNGTATDPWYEQIYILGTIREFKINKSKGSLINSVSSTNASAFPNDGISDEYYYVSIGTDISYSKGNYIEEVTSTDPAEYPIDGYLNGYWYTKIV